MSPAEEAALLARVTMLEEAVEHLTAHVQGDLTMYGCEVCARNTRCY